MLRKLTIFIMSVVFCLSAVGCSSSPQLPQNQPNSTIPSPTQLNDGKYPVQQATYNDLDGSYSLMLLNTPPGTPPVFATQNLQMARLTDEQIQAGEKTYLEMQNHQPVMHLTEDFKIEYVHNVAETQPNPQTGQQETVIVRRESSFWTPFAGAIAGQMVANMLFTPQYYVPPVYQSGGVMRGYGGYGRTYDGAVQQYQSRYSAPPAAVKNRQTFRTTGNLRNSPSSATRKTQPNNTRATGSGFGSSTLRQSDRSNSNSKSKRRNSFGSGSKSRPVRSRRRR